MQTAPGNVDEPSVPSPGPPPEASSKNVRAPKGAGDWRSHIFFFWLGIGGAVGTLIGLCLSVYFYQASQIKPLLTFSVHPLKTELQRPDFDKELGFIYKGKPVDSASITSVQVSIWNAGTRSIRDSDVLDPFRLAMPDRAAILSVRVKKTARPICGFERLDNQDDYKSGTCYLKWRILEPGDGAVLQIIYAGSAHRDPTLEGVVEGEREGVVVEQYNLNFSKTGIEDFIPRSRIWPIFGLILIALSLIFIGLRIQAKTEIFKKWAEEKAEPCKTLGRTTEEDCSCTATFFATLCRRGCVPSGCCCIDTLTRTCWAAIRLVGNS